MGYLLYLYQVYQVYQYINLKNTHPESQVHARAGTRYQV